MAGRNANEKIVMIVEDIETSREILTDIAAQMGYRVICATNGEEALALLEKDIPDILITDLYMPQMDGIELCSRIKENPKTAQIHVIFTSAETSDRISECFRCGGEDFIMKPFCAEMITAKLRTFTKLIDTGRERDEAGRLLQLSVMDQIREIETEKKNVLFALTRVIKENFVFDTSHSQRLAYNCRMMAEALSLSNEYGNVISDSFIDTIEIAAPICDLGNVAIPSSILQKNAKLTNEERDIIEQHTTYGGNIVKDIMNLENNNDFLKMSYDIACNHHEYYNGMGYPEGKKGDEIPLCAQIVSIVSAYCAMTEDRPYREAYTPAKTIEIIKRMAGEEFDPFLCNVMGLIVNRLK